MTTFLLEQAGLPTPPTFAVEGLAPPRKSRLASFGRGPLVLKPLFGAQGRGITHDPRASDLPAPEEVDGVYYLQHYVPRDGPPFRDFRVFVVRRQGGGDDAAPRRRLDHQRQQWGCAGAGCAGMPRAAWPSSPSPPLKRSARILPASTWSSARDGCPFVLEVNSMPAWSGLQSVVAVNIADAIAGPLLPFLAGVPAPRGARPARLVAPANRDMAISPPAHPRRL